MLITMKPPSFVQTVAQLRLILIEAMRLLLLQIKEGALRRVHQRPATGEVPMNSSDDWKKTVRLNKAPWYVGCGKIKGHGPGR
jgi:hypothetical protein